MRILRDKINKFTILILIVSSIIISCENTSENSQEVLDLSGMELDGILDFNTKLTKEQLQSESSSEILSFLIKSAGETGKNSSSEKIGLKFYYKNTYLYASRQAFTHVPPENGGAGGDETDCGQWKHCKTCHSEGCVTDFIKEMADKYDCFEIRVHRKTFSAKVYGRPCN